MDRIQNQPPMTTSFIGRTNEAERAPSASFLRHLTGCFNSSTSLSGDREKISTLCSELRRLYLGQNNEVLSSGFSQAEKYRADDIDILSTLDSATNRKVFEILEEYIEGKVIQNHK